MCVPRAWFVWKSVALGVVLACASAGAKNWQDDCVFSPSAENAVSAECEFRSIEVCLSSLTVNDASEDALTLSEDSPVSLYGRVCPSEAVAAREHTQCIGEKNPALVSIGVFRERCCSDGLGSKSPACPSLAQWSRKHE
ncbi:hypothetical protein FJT64_013660 [Amphibalanus amphitrite]|uniref:Secreted protein n=1 Tax=Amphibalanus amphitrite TaxID=1232801 RepID=A0A6A4UW12_AMPAM|nr:hypothetical protein FJT64_013660 [Amphibalanus amphitrite]